MSGRSPAFRTVNRESVVAHSVLALAVLPSLVWVLLDRQAWTWDSSWYGYHTLKLFYALWETPTQWARAMLTIQEVKAPGISWIGQFFVPLGWLLGSPDQGLLTFVVLTQFLALTLLYRSVAVLSDGKTLAALSAPLSLAAGPLFVAMSHEYFTEALQTLAVCWFVLIMALAPRWSRSLTLAQLTAATAFALLAKASSPLYCIGPGLVALVSAFRSNVVKTSADWRSQRGTILTLAAGVPLALATCGWYWRNLTHVAQLVASAASSPHYGFADTIWNKLQYWIGACRYDFSYLPVTAVVAVTIVGWACISLSRSARRWNHFDLCASVCALETAGILLVFSASVNQATRYLLPLFVFFSVLIAWALSRVSKTQVSWVVNGAFLLQLVVVHGQAFGMLASDPRDYLSFLRPVDRNREGLQERRAIVRRTCRVGASGPGQPNITMVGVQLPSLNQDTLNYLALQDPRCRKAKGEFWGTYTDSLDRTWQLMKTGRFPHVVTVDPALQDVPKDWLNEITVPFLNRLRSDASLREERLAESRRILLFHASP